MHEVVGQTVCTCISTYSELFMEYTQTLDLLKHWVTIIEHVNKLSVTLEFL